MIDRNIRNTRSKEETKKAHRQAILTALILLILFIVVTRVQNLIMVLFRNMGVPFIGLVLSVCAGIAIVGAVVYFVYRRHGR